MAPLPPKNPRLADFIQRNMERILGRWETFAASILPAAGTMSPQALRDHAQQILEAVVKDLRTQQSREAQVLKSMGRASQPVPAAETAAQTHGFLRAQSGFEINQMASEYRALRASVLRLWLDACAPEAPNVEDIIRFNEAIDQAISESIAFFSKKVEEARNLLLGMLGHDLRSPLQAIQMTAMFLAELNAGPDVNEAAAHLIHSGSRMQGLVDDLVEFNRSKLGLGIRVDPTQVDVADLFAGELAQVRAAHPGRQLDFEINGQTQGFWDGPALQRLLDNLLINALKYGSQDTPVGVRVNDVDGYLEFEVRNKGAAIAPAVLEQLFEPLKRGLHSTSKHSQDSGMGLGLYIAREIARAHGGDIEARVEQDGVCLAVRLPRRPDRGPGS